MTYHNIQMYMCVRARVSERERERICHSLLFSYVKFLVLRMGYERQSCLELKISQELRLLIDTANYLLPHLSCQEWDVDHNCIVELFDIS